MKPTPSRAARLAACSALTSLVFTAPAAGQPPAFKSGTRVVPLTVTVTDPQRRLVPDLQREDFEILDNDKPQPIAIFENGTLPISVVVMLDTSASMTSNLKLLNLAAEQFLLRLLPDDKGMVGAFNDKVEFANATFTSDRDRLIALLRDLDFGNPTRLYDAISESIDQLTAVEGRRVVLVFTDGEDTSSHAKLGDAIEKARAQDVMVYAIGLQSEYFNGVSRVRSRPDRGLKKLAEETGGGFYELSKTDELSSTFTRVAQELHSQYVLGFTPAALDGKVHKVSVRVRQPGMTVRTRKTYLAAADKPTDNKW